jgi:dihydroorotate dehydrogenase
LLIYKKFIFPVLSKFDPEQIHYLAMKSLVWGCKIPFVKSIIKGRLQVVSPKLERKVLGLDFKNPIGLAAGFDKNGQWIDELSCLGFGFIEIGTVTPKPQDGNPKPRLFRLKKDKALINRMGFNNQGLEAVVRNLKKRHSTIIVGGNIGKNKNTENTDAISDYLNAFHSLFDYVDYFVVNVSSPNTPGLRELQEKGPLTEILARLQKANQLKAKTKPIVLKIAPDLTNHQLDDIVSIVLETQIAGIIATNTTLSRENLKEDFEKIGSGGLSGKPLKNRATEVIRYLYEKSGGKFDIIGVGGIFDPEDALEKLEAGASLVQIYTSFVYEGPALVKKLNLGLLKNESSGF